MGQCEGDEKDGDRRCTPAQLCSTEIGASQGPASKPINPQRCWKAHPGCYTREVTSCKILMTKCHHFSRLVVGMLSSCIQSELALFGKTYLNTRSLLPQVQELPTNTSQNVKAGRAQPSAATSKPCTCKPQQKHALPQPSSGCRAHKPANGNTLQMLHMTLFWTRKIWEVNQKTTPHIRAHSITCHSQCEACGNIPDFRTDVDGVRLTSLL